MGRDVTEELYQRRNPHKVRPEGSKGSFLNEGRREKREKNGKRKSWMNTSRSFPPREIPLTWSHGRVLSVERKKSSERASKDFFFPKIGGFKEEVDCCEPLVVATSAWKERTALSGAYRSGGEACVCRGQGKQEGGHLERMRSSTQGHLQQRGREETRDMKVWSCLGGGN